MSRGESQNSLNTIYLPRARCARKCIGYDSILYKKNYLNTSVEIALMIARSLCIYTTINRGVLKSSPDYPAHLNHFILMVTPICEYICTLNRITLPPTFLLVVITKCFVSFSGQR